MSHKEILQVIQRERLKEIRSGTSPLACLNAMLHTNSRGEEGIFYKVPGRMGVYTLKKDISDVAQELSEEGSEESSSDNLSDSRSSDNIAEEQSTRGRWMRRVPSKLQSQPSSPQPRCSSPSVPTAKLISPSQKHSKKALKQALKQQQQRNQRRQGGMTTASSPRLLLKAIKDITMVDNITTKPDLCDSVGARKVSQRSSRLSAGQIKRTKCNIDVETPDSILVNTNLRAIINKHTFSVLPPECQQRLLKLLPEVDRQTCMDGLLKVTSSALNNEFFTSAAQSWKERLAEGEFTPELQLRMRQEIEKEKKMESWKEAFFETYYGENSGLSYEESKELTRPDQKSLPPKTGRVAKSTEEDSNGNQDNQQSEAPATSAKDIKPTPEPSRDPPKPPQKEPSLVLEPMRTRRSQQAEDRLKLNSALQSVTTPTNTNKEEVKTQAEESIADKIPKKESLEETPKKTEPLQSPVKESPPPKTSPGMKVEQPVSTEKPAEPENKVEAPGSEPPKRKSTSETESELTPEKRPRMSSVSSVSSVSSSVSPPASSISSPATPSPAANQKVPPLKIHVSRILTGPVSPGQASPRTPLPTPLSSPGRTGARTLADIKAKAQLARAQRSAAARGAVPGPGPGGGGGNLEQTQPSPSPSPSPTSPPASVRLPSTSLTCSPPPLCPFDSKTTLSPTPTSVKNDDRLKVGVPSSGQVNSASSALNTSPSTPSVKTQEHPSPAGSTRSSSCIPANNPLVTQLLQGKEVPLEQILPKPVSKVEVKMAVKSSGAKGKTLESPGNSSDNKQTSFSSPGRGLSEHKHHKELPDKETQEQILQALMQRKAQQSQPFGGIGSPSTLYRTPQLGQSEERQTRISVGFWGCKRKQKPAMTGHYLLNVSTYGRGSERQRQQQQHAAPNTSVSALKRESTDGREVGKDVALSGVKIEQQTYSISKSDEAGFQHCAKVKNEPGFEDSENSSSGTAKDTSSHRRNLNCNSNQGNSEPYFTQTGHHQRSTHKTTDNQDAGAASCYGGTISMTVPQTLNHGGADSGSSTSYSEADSGQHGSVMSFSVTVTTIPAGRSIDHSGQGEPSPEQSFIEGPNMEDVQSKCYCRLKAMIMCKGCGAFCHDDCIGPSKLCVSCLVVR